MRSGTYTLYWDYQTSAFIPHVMLEELGVAYDLERIDTGRGAHHDVAFRTVNPNALLPALRLPDGRTLGENGAILLMLGDRHPEQGMVPRPEDADRPAFLHWLFALATTGHTTARRHAYPDLYTSRQDALDGMRAVSGAQLGAFFRVLEDVISGAPWFLPRGFGPLDTYLYMLLHLQSEAERAELFGAAPRLAAIYREAGVRETVAAARRRYFESGG